MNELDNIHNLLAENKIKEALQELLLLVASNNNLKWLTTVTILKADFEAYEIQEIQGLDVRGKRNEILKRTLDVLEKIQTEKQEKANSKKKKKRGFLLHSIPKKMQQHNLHRCIIRVAFDRDTILEDLHELADNVVIKEKIRLENKMAIVFSESEYFEVIAHNQQEQIVEEDEDEFTEWNFDVKPLKQGLFPITFKVIIILANGNKEIVFTESIEVVIEPVESALVFEFIPFNTNHHKNQFWLFTFLFFGDNENLKNILLPFFGIITLILSLILINSQNQFNKKVNNLKHKNLFLKKQDSLKLSELNKFKNQQSQNKVNRLKEEIVKLKKKLKYQKSIKENKSVQIIQKQLLKDTFEKTIVKQQKNILKLNKDISILRGDSVMLTGFIKNLQNKIEEKNQYLDSLHKELKMRQKPKDIVLTNIRISYIHNNGLVTQEISTRYARNIKMIVIKFDILQLNNKSLKNSDFIRIYHKDKLFAISRYFYSSKQNEVRIPLLKRLKRGRYTIKLPYQTLVDFYVE